MTCSYLRYVYIFKPPTDYKRTANGDGKLKENSSEVCPCKSVNFFFFFANCPIYILSCKKENNSPTHCNADSCTAGLQQHCFPGGLLSYPGETVAHLFLPLHDHSWRHLLNILLLQATSLICVLAGRYFSPSGLTFELQKCKWPEKPNELSICPKSKERPWLLLLAASVK